MTFNNSMRPNRLHRHNLLDVEIHFWILNPILQLTPLVAVMSMQGNVDSTIISYLDNILPQYFNSVYLIRPVI